MKRLGEIGPSRGVFPEPEKSQYVHSERVMYKAARFVTASTTLKYRSGSQNLVGHTGSQQTRNAWIKTEVTDWDHRMTSLGKRVKYFPQTAYPGLVKSLQNEWTYHQRVTSGNGRLYNSFEKAIREDFLPALLD